MFNNRRSRAYQRESRSHKGNRHHSHGGGHQESGPKKLKASPDVFKAVIGALKSNADGLWLEDIAQDASLSLQPKKVSFGRNAIRNVIRMLRGCAFVEWVRHAFVKIKPEYLGLSEKTWIDRVFFGNNPQAAV